MKDKMNLNDVVLPKKRQNESTLKQRMTDNAYNQIMPARYQTKDENGNVIETPENVFRRVAKNIALGDLPQHKAHITEGLIKDHPRRDELIDDVFGDVKTGSVPATEHVVKHLDYDKVMDAPESLINDETKEALRETYEEFHDLMEHLSFIPNTPTLINAGNDLQQLSACFVISPKDDMGDIHQTAKEAAEIFQSGGGMGYGFWKLRPYGDRVGSTGGIASGPITFMRTYDQMCKTIAQGGTRRGAQMGVMRVSHPDVIEFMHSKNKDVSLAISLGLNDPKDPTHTSFSEALDEARSLIRDGKIPNHLRNAVEGHLANFNISVGITNEFMRCLKNDEDYTFINPRTEEPHVASAETEEMYSRYGLGNYVNAGEILRIPANILWEHIIAGAHENGEPGVIYLDRVNTEHSFDSKKYPDHEILATNPCGEQPLEEYEACNLGHINLSTLAREDAPDWRIWYNSLDSAPNFNAAISDFMHAAIDVEELNRRIDSGVHFLDNVVTMSNFPIPEIEEKVTSQRKIGLGVMGLAQLYIQLGIEYGSDIGDEMARYLMKYINHRSKQASRNLAENRGVFKAWQESKYATPTRYVDWFEKHVGKQADDWEGGFPIRNHNTTTVAPTGTTSMVGNTSSGIEPLYNVAFFKNVSQDIQGDEMLVEFDDYFLRVLEENNIDTDAVKTEAEEKMRNGEFESVASLDLVPDSIASLFVTAGELSALEHASVQCAAQEGVDSAISKTCNFSNDATIDDVKEVYEYIYNNGGKGVTVYRDGSRSKQVLTTTDKIGHGESATSRQIAQEYISDEYDLTFEDIESLLHTDNTSDVEPTNTTKSQSEEVRPRERPSRLRGTMYPIKTGYGEINVTINEDEYGEPLEVWAEIGKSGGFTHSLTEAVGRLASVALRAGVASDVIMEQLDGIRSPKIAWHGQEQIHSIPDAIAKALKSHEEGETHPDTSNLGDNTPQTTVQEEFSGGIDDPSLVDGCPKCGAEVAFEEGCRKCSSRCGWSECAG